MIIYFLFGLLTTVNAYNILIVSPAFANSHLIFMGQLADTLTDAGHNVTLLVPVMDETRRNKTGVKSTKDVIWVDQDEIARKNIVTSANKHGTFWTDNYKAEDYYDSYSFFQDNLVETCANIFRQPEILAQLKTRNFDVVLNEPLSICGLGLAYRLGVRKMILTTSCTLYEYLNPYLGESDDSSYVPSVLASSGDQMTFMKRYENFKTTYYMRKSIDGLFDEEEKRYTENYQVEMPSWRELLASTSIHFTNANAFVDFPRPTIQKTVFIGGVSVNMEHIRSQKIDDEWENVLKLRNRTMLISFGSMILSKDMPIVYRETLLRVIESLPDVTFIWKYESDDTKWAEHVPNVHFSKWVPQTALLNDKRVTAFLTHGGLGSINELAYSGKPALMVPIFWDQARNGEMYSRLGAAATIKKEDLDNFDLLRTSIQSILYDGSYTKHAQRIADILENQPVKPKDLVVKYTEFVARFGPFPNMDPYVRHLNFIQRIGLDVLVMFYGRSIVLYLLIGLVLKLVFSSGILTLGKNKIH